MIKGLNWQKKGETLTPLVVVVHDASMTTSVMEPRAVVIYARWFTGIMHGTCPSLAGTFKKFIGLKGNVHLY